MSYDPTTGGSYCPTCGGWHLPATGGCQIRFGYLGSVGCIMHIRPDGSAVQHRSDVICEECGPFGDSRRPVPEPIVAAVPLSLCVECEGWFPANAPCNCPPIVPAADSGEREGLLSPGEYDTKWLALVQSDLPGALMLIANSGSAPSGWRRICRMAAESLLATPRAPTRTGTAAVIATSEQREASADRMREMLTRPTREQVERLRITEPVTDNDTLAWVGMRSAYNAALDAVLALYPECAAHDKEEG